jgi:hypothetical protein
LEGIGYEASDFFVATSGIPQATGKNSIFRDLRNVSHLFSWGMENGANLPSNKKSFHHFVTKIISFN